MSPCTMFLRQVIAFITTIHLALAVPPSTPPGLVCRGPALAVLQGPFAKEAKAFCSSYLHYPKTETVIVKTTSTLTKGYTLPASTQSVTATSEQVNSKTVTATSTAPGEVFTSTATATTTAEPMGKREADYGATDGFLPPGLVGFQSGVISSACSCIVTPTTTTITSTSTSTATATLTATPSPKTTTVATITNAVTVTVTASATFTAEPSTTTTTVTTTATSTPPKICSEDISAAQRQVTGFVASTSSRLATPSRIRSAEDCYTYCRDLIDPFDPVNTTPITRSYTFKPSTDPDQNMCACYTNQICNFVTPDPNGDVLAGDTSVPF